MDAVVLGKRGGGVTQGNIILALHVDRMVEQIAKSLGTALQIQLLKIDVEGAEVSV